MQLTERLSRIMIKIAFWQRNVRRISDSQTTEHNRTVFQNPTDTTLTVKQVKRWAVDKRVREMDSVFYTSCTVGCIQIGA